MTLEHQDNTVISAVLRDIAASVGASDFARAAALATDALNRGMVHPALFNAHALLAQQEGRHEEALADFQRAFAFTPKDVALLNAIGLCLVRVNRADEATAVFDSALRIAPALAPTHFRKGWAHAACGDYDLARKAYERAVQLQPNYAEAIAGLAWIAARNGDAAKARLYGERVLKLDGRQTTANGALATAEIAEGLFEQAEHRLEPLLADENLDRETRATLTGFFADALDGQGRIEEAFAAYSASNSELRALHAARFPDERRLSRHVSDLIGWLDSGSAPTGGAAVLGRHAMVTRKDAHSTPKDGRASREPRQHVFLLGFMRSGTTLLEQALARHPDVVSLEERDTLSPLANEFLSDFPALMRLASLTPPDMNRVCEQYWQRVKSFGIDAAGKAFIDKQPLASINLPVIANLFPTAKILLAVRDPRDVVFSCFRRHFEIGPASFELLELEDAARFYDSVMQLVETCRTRMSLPVFEQRYEDMIANLEQRLDSICDFIGIEPCDTMGQLDGPRKDIRSASAAQIRRGLYAGGSGHWRRYRKHLEPILPILAPWVRRFGYSDE